MALVSLISVVVLYKFVTFFVYRVVGQVGILIAFYTLGIVFLACESGKPLVVHVYSPRIHGGYQDVDSYIEFQAIYKHWIRNVPAHDTGLVNRYFGYIIHYENSFSLARIVWLHYPMV